MTGSNGVIHHLWRILRASLDLAFAAFVGALAGYWLAGPKVENHQIEFATKVVDTIDAETSDWPFCRLVFLYHAAAGDVFPALSGSDDSPSLSYLRSRVAPETVSLVRDRFDAGFLVGVRLDSTNVRSLDGDAAPKPVRNTVTWTTLADNDYRWFAFFRMVRASLPERGLGPFVNYSLCLSKIRSAVVSAANSVSR